MGKRGIMSKIVVCHQGISKFFEVDKDFLAPRSAIGISESDLEGTRFLYQRAVNAYHGKLDKAKCNTYSLRYDREQS